MPTGEEKDIFSVLAYHNFFGYPLTPFELYKWQYKPREILSYEVIESILNNSEWMYEQGVRMSSGFYGIENEHAGTVEKQVQLRQNRYLNAVEKQKKLRRIIAYLSRLPWIEGVAVCNSLALHYTDRRSDIDLFVLAKSGRIWSTRFWSLLPLRLFRQRPGECAENPIDISFFVTRDAFNLSKLEQKDGDPYLVHWINFLVPVYEKSGVFYRFFQENRWARNNMPIHRITQRAYTGRQWTGRKIVLPLFETVLKSLQESMFTEDVLAQLNKGTNVMATNTILKFHKNDRREEIADHWRSTRV